MAGGTRTNDGRRQQTRQPDVARTPLRRTPAARTDPGHDLQRQGGARAPGSPRPGSRPHGPGAHDGLELPQLLPPGPDRFGVRGRPATESGRARWHRPDAAPAGPGACARAPVPRRLVGARSVRPVHQPGQGRAGHARRLRYLRGRGTSRIRGALRALWPGGCPARSPGQPRAAARDAQGVRQAPPIGAGGGPRRRAAGRPPAGSGQGCRAGGATDRPGHRCRPEHQALHAPAAARG